MEATHTYWECALKEGELFYCKQPVIQPRPIEAVRELTSAEFESECLRLIREKDYTTVYE